MERDNRRVCGLLHGALRLDSRRGHIEPVAAANFPRGFFVDPGTFVGVSHQKGARVRQSRYLDAARYHGIATSFAHYVFGQRFDDCFVFALAAPRIDWVAILSRRNPRWGLVSL